MKHFRLSSLATLALLSAVIAAAAQDLDSVERPHSRSERGFATGLLTMTTTAWTTGPTVEARYIHPVTRYSSLRARIGLTGIIRSLDTVSELGRLLVHGALEAYWTLTPRAATSVLYGTFGMTAILYDFTDRTEGWRFYLVELEPDGGSASTTEIAFGPSAGIGVNVALDDRITLSGELQGVVNLVYPYFPPFGASAMVGIGWKL